MRNVAFVVWLLGWFFIQDIAEYHYFLVHGKIFEPTDGFAWIFLAIWVFVGISVYEKRGK